MNQGGTAASKKASGKQEDMSDQVILDFYNLATGRLLTGLEVSNPNITFTSRWILQANNYYQPRIRNTLKVKKNIKDILTCV